MSVKLKNYQIKYKFFLLFCITTFTNDTISQTIIPSGFVSGLWAKSSSPYKIQGDVTIPKDSILIIEPGTVIEFQDKYAIKVDGILKAEGKLGDSIVFKAATSKVWAGIQFINNKQSDTFKFSYCRFENCGDGYKNGYIQYAVSSRYSNPITIKNSAFYYLYKNDKEGGGIYCRKGAVFVEYISVYSLANNRNPAFIYLDTAFAFRLHGIRTNLPLGLIKPFPDIMIDEFSGSYGIIEDVLNIANSSIYFGIFNSKNIQCNHLNLRDKVTFNIGPLRNSKISNLVIFNSYNTPINTYDNCTSTIFENCEIRNCGSNKYDQYGILYYCMDLQSSGPLFKNCLITDNNWGFHVGQKNGNGSPVFLNCEIFKNKFYSAVIEGYPVFVNCNIQDNSTFYKNPFDTGKVAPYTGGITVLTEFYPSRPYFYNCLFWGNKDSLGNRASIAFFRNNSNVRADLYNCILQGDSSTGVGGYDDNTFKKFKVNPAYFTYVKSSGHPPGFIDSASGNYSLKNTCDTIAYAINRGMTGNLLTQYPYSMLKSQYGIDIYNSEDLAGNPRVMDDTIDIGCYESSGTKHALDLLSTYRDSIICYGGSNSYKVKTYGTVQNYNWQLKNGNSIQTISSSNTLVLNNQRTNGLKYRLMVTNSECEDLSDSSTWFTLYVNGPIKKGITRNPNKDTIELKETMTLSTTATGYNQINWSNGQTGPSISFKGSDLGNSGIYRFELEARKNDGCIETDTAFVVIKENTSLESLLIKGWKVYPNPTNGIIYLDSPNGDFYSVELTDWMGNSILIKNNLSDQSTINIAELPSGVYHVKLITIDFIEVIKVLKL